VSSYLRSIVYKGSFDGDEVEVVLRPLQFKDAIKFRGMDNEAVPGALMDLLPEYLTEVKGLRAADGSVVTREELLGAAYFAPLLAAAGMELIQHAVIKNP